MEALIKSYSSFPRKREPSQINMLDPRFRGDDDLFSVSLALCKIGGYVILCLQQNY